MGGYGSGRDSYRGVLEDHLRLDVGYFLRHGLLSSTGHAEVHWSREGAPWASVRVHFSPEALELEYVARPGTEEARDLRYRVEMTWTPCTYGGSRPWFVCPNQRCRRRVGKLYLYRGYFLCRHCTGEGYQSQRWDRSDRLMERARKIRMRLGGGVNLMEPFPWKPKAMHWRTYWRLREEYDWANNASVVLIAQKFGIGL